MNIFNDLLKRMKENHLDYIFYNNGKEKYILSTKAKNKDINTNKEMENIENDTDKSKIIKSPMVGIVHLEDNVKLNNSVKKGDLIAQIESMKVFSDVYAENGGTIKKIYVENEDTVEYGGNLIGIE